MNLRTNTPHKKARIEIIPLIDIMFFLLASFMLVSMSMIKLQKIDTTLPGKNHAPPPAEKQDFTVIGIDAKSEIYYDKDQNSTTIPALIPRLGEIYKVQREQSRIYINCDKAAKYDQLISVLDTVRNVGITKVSFNVKKDNAFDPAKPRPNTHVTPGAPGTAPAAPGTPAAPAAPATTP